MENIKIGSRREVCWDEWLLDTAEGIRVQMHRPQYRNVVLECNENWEGNASGGYATLLEDGGKIRLYYRGFSFPSTLRGKKDPGHLPVLCLAESEDGRVFHRVPLELERYYGRKDNNIIPFSEEERKRGSFFVFCDSNPSCPPDQRYKALVELPNQSLCYFKSADGVNFERVRILADDGAYDSLNVAFWDADSAQYFLFYRGVHGADAEGGKWKTGAGKQAHNDYLVRDIRVRTSKDFVTWEEPRMIRFAPERDDVDLYINNIQKYYRADHMFLGLPVRYIDRYHDHQNFSALPGLALRESLFRYRLPREATVVTDALVMTSRDGYTFRRTEEAFLTPGIECADNWIYGDCYFFYGMAETPSDIPGAPNEISLYTGRGYRSEHVRICRYTLRLDGFFSWHCDYTPGKLLTKPMVFDGDSLHINFATSCAGYVQIRLTDVNGTVLDGYDSGKLFGDSVARTVRFERSLKELSGREIRMEISMRDADLYSFRFDTAVKWGSK